MPEIKKNRIYEKNAPKMQTGGGGWPHIEVGHPDVFMLFTIIMADFFSSVCLCRGRNCDECVYVCCVLPYHTIPPGRMIVMNIERVAMVAFHLQTVLVVAISIYSKWIYIYIYQGVRESSDWFRFGFSVVVRYGRTLYIYTHHTHIKLNFGKEKKKKILFILEILVKMFTSFMICLLCLDVISFMNNANMPVMLYTTISDVLLP